VSGYRRFAVNNKVVIPATYCKKPARFYARDLEKP
jgi:hypothetical protein